MHPRIQYRIIGWITNICANNCSLSECLVVIEPGDYATATNVQFPVDIYDACSQERYEE